jgi:hypothetical protein
MVAHDCRNRLSVIIGNGDLAMEKIPGDSEIAKRFAIVREGALAIAAEFDKPKCNLPGPPRSDGVTRSPASTAHEGCAKV